MNKPKPKKKPSVADNFPKEMFDALSPEMRELVKAVPPQFVAYVFAVAMTVGKFGDVGDRCAASLAHIGSSLEQIRDLLQAAHDRDLASGAPGPTEG